MDNKVSVGMVAAIVIIVAITAIILGAKFVNTKNVATAPVPVVQQPSSPVTPAQNPVAVSPNNNSALPADWKTYRNDKYGFELTLSSINKPYVVKEFPLQDNSAYNPFLVLEFASGENKFTVLDSHSNPVGDLLEVWVFNLQKCNDNISDTGEKTWCKRFSASNEGIIKNDWPEGYWVKNGQNVIVFSTNLVEKSISPDKIKNTFSIKLTTQIK